MTDNSKSVNNGRKLHGVVLIMVITVMTVLIIMLVATLTVVTTARNKYYTKYEENQAYYTTRSAIDIFMKGMISDSTNTAYDRDGNPEVFEYTTHDDHGVPTGSGTINMTQGLALQTQFYKLKAQNNPDSVLSNILSTELIAANVAYEYDQDQYLYIRSTTDVPGEVLNEDFIYYYITLPSTPYDTNKIGKFADYVNDSNVINDHDGHHVIIKAEVIDRTYALGGDKEAAFTKIMNDNTPAVVSAFHDLAVSGTAMSYDADGDGTSESYEYKDLIDAIHQGNRSDDYINVRFTAVSDYGNADSKIIVEGLPRQEITNEGNHKAFTSAGGNDATFKNGNIIGGLAVDHPMNPDNEGIIVGAIYAEGGWTHPSNGPDMQFLAGEAEGGFTVTTSATHPTVNMNWNENHGYYWKGFGDSAGTKDTRPLIYIDGILNNTNGKGLSIGYGNGEDYGSGSAQNKVDILCRGIGSGINNGFKVNGDVYVMGDLDLSNNAGFGGVNGLKIDGSLYVDGYIKLTQNFQQASMWYTMSGPARVLKINESGHITGGVYCKGFILDGTPATPLELSSSTNYTILPDNTFNISNGVVTLPYYVSGVSQGSVTHTIATSASCYDPYINKETGAIMTAEEYAFTSSANKKAGTGYSTDTFTALLAAAETGGTLPDLPTNPGSPISVSTGAGIKSPGASYYIANGNGGATAYNNVRIEGGGVVNLYLKSGVTPQGSIIVASDTTVNVIMDGNITINNFQIYHEYVKNCETSGSTINVGWAGWCPKINYFMTTGSSLEMTNNCLLVGYVYAPYAAITMKQGRQLKFNYIGSDGSQGVVKKRTESGSDPSNIQICFIGAVFCKDFTSADATGGIAYVEQEGGAGDYDLSSGAPFTKFTPARYKRS